MSTASAAPDAIFKRGTHSRSSKHNALHFEITPDSYSILSGQEVSMLDTGMVMAGYILFCFFASAIGASEFCTSLVSFAVVFIAMMFGVLVVVSTNAMENVYYFSGAVSIVL